MVERRASRRRSVRSEPPFEGFHPLNAILDTLQEDMDQVIALGDSQFARRAYVRTVFSAMDGTLNGLSAMLLSFPQAQLLLDQPTITLLREVTYELADDGTVRERNRYVSFLPKVRLVLRAVFTIGAAKVTPDYSLVGWRAMREAEEVRNRLTHPRSVQELNVSNADIEQLHLAKNWFFGQTFRVLGYEKGP